MGGFLKHAIWTGGDLGKGSRNPIMFLALGNSLSARDRNGVLSLTSSGALRYAPGNGGKTNYAKNPRGTQIAFNGAGTVTSAIPISDHPLNLDTAARIQGSAVDDGGTFLGTAGFDPTQPVTFSVYVKLESGEPNWKLTSSFRKADGSVIGDSTLIASVALTTGWQRITGTITPSSAWTGAHPVNLKIIRPTGAAGASSILATGALIEQGSSASAYFDGAMPGCAWADPITGIAGTANASPSISRATLWIEEATTNLVINPSAENASVSTGTTPFGTTAPTITKDTTYALFGSSAFKVVTAGAGPTEGIGIISASSLGYTGSARTFVASGYLRGSGQVDVYARVLYTDLSPADTVHITYTLTDAYTRIIPSAITLDPLKTVNQIMLVVRTTGTAAITFYVDGVQVEEKTYATSYCDGALGGGYSWSGTAHSSASSRVAAIVSASPTNRINMERGSMVGRFSILEAASGAQYVMNAGDPGPGFDFAGLRSATGAGNIQGVHYINGVSGLVTDGAIGLATFRDGYTEWSAAATGVRMDAGSLTTGTRNYPITGNLTGKSIVIGDLSGNLYLDGLAGPLAIFDRPLTVAELTKLKNIDPTLWWSALS